MSKLLIDRAVVEQAASALEARCAFGDADLLRAALAQTEQPAQGEPLFPFKHGCKWCGKAKCADGCPALLQSKPAEPVNQVLLDALETIALAGMSGSGQESEEALNEWRAQRAWEFISIAACALEKAKAVTPTIKDCLIVSQPLAEQVQPAKREPLNQDLVIKMTIGNSTVERKYTQLQLGQSFNFRQLVAVESQRMWHELKTCLEITKGQQ